MAPRLLAPVTPSGKQARTWCTDLAALLAEEGGGGLGGPLGSYVLLRSGVCHWNIGQHLLDNFEAS